jgi:hypothetical protein
MKRIQARLMMVLVMAILSVTILPLSLHADSFSVNLTQSDQSGYNNSVLTFSGSFQNISGSSLFVNGTNFSLDPGDLTYEDTVFFNIASIGTIALGPGNGDSGDFFTITIGGLAAPGTYHGTFDLMGGANDSAQLKLGQADFSVTVTETPEPSTMILLGSGLLGAAGTLRRRILG